jgi:Zn-dependent protease with chaperone function
VIVVLLLAALVGSFLPHVLQLRHAPPLTAVVIWLAALTLRAVSVALAAAWLVLFFPGTHLFEALTHWCWRHLASAALNGHDVGHVTTLVPTLLGIASIVSVAVAGVKLTSALRSLRVTTAGDGPAGSVIVGGDAITLAVVGVVRPRVLISTGALLELDDEELEAALTHERAHIARRHRYVLLWAEACRALARFMPATRKCADELAFHLERDADQWALARPVSRGALAAALRKASTSHVGGSGIVLALGATRVDERLAEILGESPHEADTRPRACALAAAFLVILLTAVLVATPPALAAGLHVVQSAPAAVDCD